MRAAPICRFGLWAMASTTRAVSCSSRNPASQLLETAPVAAPAAVHWAGTATDGMASALSSAASGGFFRMQAVAAAAATSGIATRTANRATERSKAVAILVRRPQCPRLMLCLMIT